MTVDALLQSIPPLTVYVVVGLVVGIESLGIPLPGEVVLVSAALLSSRHELAVNPIGVGTAAVIGAVIGEFVGSDNQGLGFFINQESAQGHAARAFASVVILALMGIGLFGAVALAERVLLPWRHTPAGSNEQ